MKQERTSHTEHLFFIIITIVQWICALYSYKNHKQFQVHKCRLYTIVCFTLQHGQEHSESLHIHKHIQPLHEYCTNVIDIHKYILKKCRTSQNKHGHKLTLCMLKPHVECIILYDISRRYITNLHCMIYSSNVLSLRLNYYAARMRLARELGIMMLDEQGRWIDVEIPTSLEDGCIVVDGEPMLHEAPLPPEIILDEL